MATYQELYDLTTNVPLLNKVATGVAILAEDIRAEATSVTNHDLRLAWAKRALFNVDGTARSLMWVILAMNKAATVTQIDTASDASIQTAVNAAVELLL